MLISAPKVVPALGPAILEPGYVAIEGTRITAAGAGDPPREPDLALGEGMLVPGLVDVQVNGYYGVDLATAGPAEWARVVTRLPETGTTAFLPTFITAPVDSLAESLRACAALAGPLPAGALTPGARYFSALPAEVLPTGAVSGGALPAGARVLGVHLEGPFLSPARAGAHQVDLMVPPSPQAIADLLAAGRGLLRVVTLAPEIEGGLAAVAALTGAGVVVSIGHSDATAAQVAAAADAGARMVTHLFNAQRPLHHREPGVVGQALADPRLTSGLIVDLRHVVPAACAIAFAAAPGRICLVTDAAACAGMPPGRYVLGGEPVELPPGPITAPVRQDGTLAGSALRMDRAVSNAVATGMGLAEAVAAASRIPADLIGRNDLGRLVAGAAADLAWLGDDLLTRATWVAGERVYPGDGSIPVTGLSR